VVSTDEVFSTAIVSIKHLSAAEDFTAIEHIRQFRQPEQTSKVRWKPFCFPEEKNQVH
jgi:hypothetical protein